MNNLLTREGKEETKQGEEKKGKEKIQSSLVFETRNSPFDDINDRRQFERGQQRSFLLEPAAPISRHLTARQLYRGIAT